MRDRDGGEAVKEGLDLGGEGGMDVVYFDVEGMVVLRQGSLAFGKGDLTLRKALDSIVKFIESDLTRVMLRHGARQVGPV